MKGKALSTEHTPRHRKAPRMSLRAMLLGMAMFLVVGTVLLAGVTGMRITLLVFFASISMFNLIMSSMEVHWRVHKDRTADADPSRFPKPTTFRESSLSVALLVPALNEARVIGQTLRDLADTTYDQVSTIVTLRSFDTATIQAACDTQLAIEAATSRKAPIQVLAEMYGANEKGKAHQLNRALHSVTEDITGVFDAEDTVHPELIAHVVQVFKEHPYVDIVQAGVQLMNLDLHIPVNANLWQRLWLYVRGWFCLHNCLEYWFWFSARMHYQVKHQVVPLGGNTVFIRTKLLKEMGGWPTTLTEDCALGIRAAALKKAKVMAIYDPRFVTKEETPDRLFIRRIKSERSKPRHERQKASTLVTQRTRWSQGFLEELLEGYWRLLDSPRKRWMAAYLLGMPFIQAFNGLMLIFSIIASIWLIGPVWLVMLMYSPLVPLTLTFMLQMLGLREFAKEYNKRLRIRHYLSLLIGFYPYQLVLAYSAFEAVRRSLAGHNNWVLTAHTGLHRTPETDFEETS